MSRPDYWKDCTVECEAAPHCTVCGLRKRPRGRSVPLEMGNSMCDHECTGYDQEPKPGHLWPGELADMDRVEDTTNG